MKRNHPPAMVVLIAVLLVGLAIGGGPVGFVVVLMASPLILVIIFSVRAFFHRSASISRPEQQRQDALRDARMKPHT